VRQRVLAVPRKEFGDALLELLRAFRVEVQILVGAVVQVLVGAFIGHPHHRAAGEHPSRREYKE
jgi:hypothetical protein